MLVFYPRKYDMSWSSYLQIANDFGWIQGIKKNDAFLYIKKRFIERYIFMLFFYSKECDMCWSSYLQIISDMLYTWN